MKRLALRRSAKPTELPFLRVLLGTMFNSLPYLDFEQKVRSTSSHHTYSHFSLLTPSSALQTIQNLLIQNTSRNPIILHFTEVRFLYTRTHFTKSLSQFTKSWSALGSLLTKGTESRARMDFIPETCDLWRFESYFCILF